MADSAVTFLLVGGPSGSIRIVVNEKQLINMSETDKTVLKSFHHDEADTIRPLHKLTPPFRSALLAIAGPCAEQQIGSIDSKSLGSRSKLKLDHLPNPVTFVLTHISELPPETLGMSSKCKSGDRIVYDQILGAPFLQSDFRASKPLGAMDFAVAVSARDLVWVDQNLCLASLAYVWECQYIAEMRSSVVTRLLSCLEQPLPSIKYEAISNAPFHALEAIAGEASNNEVKLGRHSTRFIRPGCGVVVETPLVKEIWAENLGVHEAFGTVVGFETRAGVDRNVEYIVVQLHMCRDNLPSTLLRGMTPEELIQTNIRVTVPFDWVSGTFRISPPLLYKATHIIGGSEDTSVGSGGCFKDKIVVCDAVIGEQDETPHSNLSVLARVNCLEVPITLRRMVPFPAECALAFLHHQHAVHCGGLYPPATWYQAHLADIVRSFAFQKTAKHLRSAKDMHTMHPRIPGAALMDLLYLRVDARHREVTVSNGNMLVQVVDFASLKDVFGVPVDKFNFIPEGYGIVKIHAPFVFKWSMYDTLEQTGPLDGSVSISVNSFTECDRMGSGVVKSSKCHPDSIKANALNQKRPRDCSADSENQPPVQPSSSELKTASAEAKRKQASMERVNRALKRLELQTSGSSLLPVETDVTKPFQPGQDLDSDFSPI